MKASTSRGQYQGVLQILHFNRRFYVSGITAVAGTGLALLFLPHLWRPVFLPAAGLALFWMMSSLIVAHYVYDRFPLYDLNWIARLLPKTPKRWVNVHCGFDETSELLIRVFPQGEGLVIDIYDPKMMPEPSIELARRLGCCAVPSVAAHYDALGAPDASFDAAFCIFAAHELRTHNQRVKLFEEIARVLAPDGDFVLMEHSRDLWNFIAFGPGFLHFFSRHTWRKAIREAGLQLQAEFPMTRFVHVYHLRRAA